MKASLDAIVHARQAAYLESLEPVRDPLLAEMEAYARSRELPISDPEVASFLAVAARSSGAKTLVELGGCIGYGAIVLARAAGPFARVVSVELDGALCRVAREFVERAGLADRIEVREASALDVMRALPPASVDFFYFDCVKSEYLDYLRLAVPALTPAGVLVADNTLYKGLVAADDANVPDEHATAVAGLRAFNEALARHTKLRAVVMPLGDGVGYAVRLGGGGESAVPRVEG